MGASELHNSSYRFMRTGKGNLKGKISSNHKLLAFSIKTPKQNLEKAFQFPLQVNQKQEPRFNLKFFDMFEELIESIAFP